MELDHISTIAWAKLARPYGQAERTLGRLAYALETTALHPTWLWRELTRVSVLLAQASGYRTRVDLLRLALIGAPLERDDHTPGLAAATRTFLAAAPLFRANHEADSQAALWPRFWAGDALCDDDSGALSADGRPGRAGEGERDRLIALVRELAGFAEDGRRPALVNLFIDLGQHAATRPLPPQLVRMALPLALAEAGLVPKAAPGLLGGRRLPLGMSRAATAEKPLTDWLALAFDDLTLEAARSYRRLVELTRQHRAWHDALAGSGMRRHARAPGALDLLTATPLVSIGLVAGHLGCSHVAAGKAVERLVDLGVLIERTTRSRHKIFVAGDLAPQGRGEVDPDRPLASSQRTPLIDVDGIAATLDGLLADLDRLNARAAERVRAGG